MKDRYKYTNILNNTDKNRVYSTTIYPIIERNIQDLYIRSKLGDRLDLLALQYYGDTRYWSLIALANQLGKGSLVVPPDIQLRIPPLTVDYDKMLKDINI